MFVYSPKRFKGSLSLSENDMQLLQLICNFDFVNDSQLDMLYSIVQHYPTRFFHPILLKWCQYSGLLQKKKKPLHPSSSSVLRNVYIPTKNCRAFLNANGFVLGGITPTYVGNTFSNISTPCCTKDHPHIRGEYLST